MKRSAGVLTYKIENNQLKVLLCHFGGPYWKNTNKGGWSLSKGELSDHETALEAAKREFQEETNLKLDSELKFLTSKKVSRKKFVVMFYTYSDFDLKNCKSNEFELEFPKGTGNIQKFPEMDQYEWMDINKAKEMIISNQRYFLNKLEEKLNNNKKER